MTIPLIDLMTAKKGMIEVYAVEDIQYHHRKAHLYAGRTKAKIHCTTGIVYTKEAKFPVSVITVLKPGISPRKYTKKDTLQEITPLKSKTPKEVPPAALEFKKIRAELRMGKSKKKVS